MLHRITTFFCLLLIILGSSWALFHPDFFRVHDFTQAARVAEMARAFQDGHSIPRWSQNFGFGYGMPLFEFYAPVPYYVGALFFLAGVPMILVMKALFLIANIVTAIGSFKLGKTLLGTTYGWVVAALVTVAPYRAVNLYIRGAVSESWAIMTLPWIGYGILKIFKKEKGGFLITTASLAILFLSHNLTSMIAVISVIAFIILGLLMTFIPFLKSKKKLTSKILNQSLIQPVISTIISGILAVSLSAYYIFPALLEKDFTRVKESAINEYFDFTIHFVYFRQFIRDSWGYGGSGWGPDDSISFYLGTTQLLLILLSMIVTVWLLIDWVRTKKITSYKLSMLCISGITTLLAGINILMTTEKTIILWQLFEPFHFIQFPWRWLSAGIVWLALLGGLVTVSIQSKIRRVLFALVVVLLTVAFNSQYFRPEEYLADFSQYYSTEPQVIATETSKTLFDYMPKAVPVGITPPASLVLCNDANNTLIACSNVDIDQEKIHQKLFRTSFAIETQVTLAIADFPGWTVTVDGKNYEHMTNNTGLIQILVPAGEHRLEATFGSTPIRTASDSISFIAFLVLGYIVIKHKVLDKKNTA